MANPHLEVFVDWSDDGDFGDANEDITADVKFLSMTHIRDLLTEHMTGKVLDLMLKNFDHKYSPPKGTISGLQPGRRAWVRMWYPYDTFDGDADTTLPNHTPDEDSEWAWTNGLRVFELDGSGAARVDIGAAGSLFHVSTMEFSDTDVEIACNFSRGTDTTDHGGLCIRYVDTQNFGLVRVDGSNIELRKVIANVGSQVAIASHTWGTSTAKFMTVKVHGTNVRVLVDNVEVINATMDDAAINAGTKHGLYCDEDADHTWLDFGGFRSLAFGRTDSIRPAPAEDAAYLGIKDEFETWRTDDLTTLNASSYPSASETSLELIENALDFASARRHHDTGTTLVNDSPEGIKALSDNALDTVHRLQDEEDGFILIDGDGFSIYENRTHRDSAPHTASKATIQDNYDGSNPGFLRKAFQWEDGRDAIENRIIVRYSRGTQAGVAVVWTSDQAADTSLAIPIGVSETMDFLVEASPDCISVWTPPNTPPTTDVALFDNADGTGTDRTGAATITFQNTGTILGKYHHLRVVNGANACYITKMQARGQGVTYNDQTGMEDSDSTSEGEYDKRIKVIECLFIDREQGAQDLATNRLARRKDAKSVMSVPMQNKDKATLHHMIQRRISDRVTVVYTDMGVNDAVFIEGESWSWDEGGTVVQRELQVREV